MELPWSSPTLTPMHTHTQSKSTTAKSLTPCPHDCYLPLLRCCYVDMLHVNSMFLCKFMCHVMCDHIFSIVNVCCCTGSRLCTCGLYSGPESMHFVDGGPACFDFRQSLRNRYCMKGGKQVPVSFTYPLRS